MSALGRALKLSLAIACWASVSVFAAERAVQTSSQVAISAPDSPVPAGFLGEVACPSAPPAAFSPAPSPRVVPFPPVRCGVCSEPECVGLTRGESCGSNPDYVCGYSGRCAEDNLSLCTCGLLQPI